MTVCTSPWWQFVLHIYHIVISAGFLLHKTPTCLLLRSDGQFEAFGFEAVSKYNELTEDEACDHFYFDRFKMKLYNNSVGLNVCCYWWCCFSNESCDNMVFIVELQLVLSLHSPQYYHWVIWRKSCLYNSDSQNYKIGAHVTTQISVKANLHS